MDFLECKEIAHSQKKHSNTKRKIENSKIKAFRLWPSFTLSLSLSLRFFIFYFFPFPERFSPVHQAPDHGPPPLQLLVRVGRPAVGAGGEGRPRAAGEEGRPRRSPLAGPTRGPGVLAVT